MNYTSPSLQCVTIVAIPQDNMASLKPLQEGAVVLHILVVEVDSGLRHWWRDESPCCHMTLFWFRMGFGALYRT